MDFIVAVDQNWGIGKKNDLLFPIPEDLKNFRDLTIGKNVICGKNTLLSFPGGKPLPGRKHFVLTHAELEEDENLVRVGSLEELFSATEKIPKDELFVIGGESVYRQLLPYCEKAYVTKIFKTDPEAEVFFPNLDDNPSFVLTDPGEKQLSKNGIEFAFAVYESKK